jgi:N4-gp56 family major capsid protein
MLMFFDIQFFADAGTNVNATATMTNAYTGDATARTDSNSMTAELKEFYDTELLENARVEQYYAQFGKRQPLPRNHKGRVEWRKWNTFPRADKLQEAVIPLGKPFGMTALYGEIDQYGIYTTISDKLELRAFDDVILGATEEMGASAAETQEALIRNALLTGTNVIYCDNITLATGAVASTPTTPATMEGSTTALSLLTPTMVNKVVTAMKKNRVPRINGKYVAVIHPSVSYHLRQSSEWIEIHKYAAPTQIFNGEIGELHGVRFIENPFAPVLTTVGSGASAVSYENKAGGATYATYFFGRDAFGIIDPEGGNLQMIVHDKDEIGGPLNQFSTIGYKFESNGATILYPERVVRVMSCSMYSATDATNY